MSDKQHKILIVEDEESLQRALGGKLQRKGWQIKTATNGKEGLSRIEAEKPDLVLLDIRMPQMNGLKMLEEVRNKYSKEELPAIILTNYNQNDNISRTLELGANTFLVKSDNSLAEIVNKIEEILG